MASVIEFGCGDGNQLSLMKHPVYMGIGVSDKAIAICKDKFREQPNFSFKTLDSYAGKQAELSLSLDVIYHLLEDDVYKEYMNSLFNASKRFVIIYSSNSGDNTGYENSHVKHRMFTKWVEDYQPSWKFINKIANQNPLIGSELEASFADFYFYKK